MMVNNEVIQIIFRGIECVIKAPLVKREIVYDILQTTLCYPVNIILIDLFKLTEKLNATQFLSDIKNKIPINKTVGVKIRNIEIISVILTMKLKQI